MTKNLLNEQESCESLDWVLDPKFGIFKLQAITTDDLLEEDIAIFYDDTVDAGDVYDADSVDCAPTPSLRLAEMRDDLFNLLKKQVMPRQDTGCRVWIDENGFISLSLHVRGHIIATTIAADDLFPSQK